MPSALVALTVATALAALALTATLVLAVAVLVHHRVSPPLPADLLGFGGLAVVMLAATTAAQLRYVRRRLLAEIDARPASRAEFPALHARCSRLARTLDMRAPRLAVVDRPVPNSLSVAGGGRGTVVVSTGLLAELDGTELDGVLAHELAHVRNRDAAVLTFAGFVPALVNADYPLARALGVDGLAGTGRAVLGSAVVAAGYLLAAPSVPAPPFPAGSVGTYVSALFALAVLGVVAFGALATPVVYLSRSLSYDREFAADRAAARATGAPALLATTLARLSGDRSESPGLDGDSSGRVRGLCFLPHGFDGAADADADDGAADADRFVGTHAHPSTRERIARLRELTAAADRGRA